MSFFNIIIGILKILAMVAIILVILICIVCIFLSVFGAISSNELFYIEIYNNGILVVEGYGTLTRWTESNYEICFEDGTVYNTHSMNVIIRGER